MVYLSFKSPKRLNVLGVSIVKLLGIESNVIHIEMVDMLNGTPSIDTKPFFLSLTIEQIQNLDGWKIRKISPLKNFVLMNVLNYNTNDK